MTTVWIKLYIGKDDPNPSAPFGIYNFDGNVDQLKEKIKEKAPNGLRHVDADRIGVYAPPL